MFLYNLETRTEEQKQTTAAILTSFSDEFETFLSQKLSNIIGAQAALKAVGQKNQKMYWIASSKTMSRCLSFRPTIKMTYFIKRSSFWIYL